jgi:hypothetical protein
MKIILASFFEPENHGSGRKIGISPGKPLNLLDEYGYDCEDTYPALSPEKAYWDYHADKKQALKEKDKDKAEQLLKQAGDKFVSSYQKILEDFVLAVKEQSEKSNHSIYDIVGLEDGDTLLTWERSGHTSYREHTAKCLRGLGYEVEEK